MIKEIVSVEASYEISFSCKPSWHLLVSFSFEWKEMKRRRLCQRMFGNEISFIEASVGPNVQEMKIMPRETRTRSLLISFLWSDRVSLGIFFPDRKGPTPRSSFPTAGETPIFLKRDWFTCGKKISWGQEMDSLSKQLLTHGRASSGVVFL